MNTIQQPIKLIAISLFVAFFLSSCSKEEPITILPICDVITVNITNNLDDDILDVDIEGVNIGTLKAGDTFNGICLDQIILQKISINGTINGNQATSPGITVGVFPIISEISTFHIKIESVENNLLTYSID